MSKTAHSTTGYIFRDEDEFKVTLYGVIYEGSGAADDPDSLEDFAVSLNYSDITDALSDEEIESLSQDLINSYATSKRQSLRN